MIPQGKGPRSPLKRLRVYFLEFRVSVLGCRVKGLGVRALNPELGPLVLRNSHLKAYSCSILAAYGAVSPKPKLGFRVWNSASQNLAAWDLIW